VLRRLRHVTFANVVSVVALFVALGGGSYAALSSDDSTPGKPASQQNKHADKPSHSDRARGKDKSAEGGGPPPWAPAHGWRCKQAGNAPGSPEFRDCIKERKSK
jgi:hypothetical protein